MEQYIDLGIYLLTLVGSFLILGLSCLMVVLRYSVKKSMLYNKMLQQLTCTFTIVFASVFIIKLFLLYILFPDIYSNTGFIALYATCVILTILIAYCLLVDNKHNIPLGILCYILFATIACSTETIMNLTIANTFFINTVSFSFFTNPLFILLLCRIIPYILLLTSLVFIIGIIIRRNKDNFGRDYYIFALRYCTHLAFIAVIALTIISIINAISLVLIIENKEALPIYVLIALPVLVSLYLVYSFKRISTISTNPMQYKISYISSFLLSLIAIYIDIFLLKSFL